MKNFNYKTDIKLKDLKNKKAYCFGGVFIEYIAGMIEVSSFCEGTQRFKTVKDAISHIKTNVFKN